MARLNKTTPYRLHKFLYKISGGIIWSVMPGGKLQVLLLTTTGRKSRLARTHPVMYYKEGANFVISPTNSGSDKPSLWYLNLKANPEATIQIKNMTMKVIAEGDKVVVFLPLLAHMRDFLQVFQQRAKQ